MQTGQLLFEGILNIGLLVLIANLLLKFQIVQDIIVQERRSWQSQALLSVIFGAVIMLSTCTARDFGAYDLNTRMIGAMTAGLLGGPLAGLYASLMGAVHAYLCLPDMYAMAAAFSTMLFGLLGGGFYPYFQRGKWEYKDLFLLACFAEICDMVCLLRFAESFQQAWEAVFTLSFLMIIFNAAGLLIFISSFNTIFVMQDLESSRQLHRASELAQKCLPLFVEGLDSRADMQKLTEIMLEEIDSAGVMITDRKKIIAESQNKEAELICFGSQIPEIGRRALKKGRLETMYQVPVTNPLYESMKEYSLAAVPFVIKDQAIGSLIVWVRKKWVFQQSELEILQNLVRLCSYQIAAAELEQQKIMRQKAEFKALQFQVSPHFLFNALNTISCVCREDPPRARELLLTLASYFRYNLQEGACIVPMEEELEHVKDYLELEKARFEEKLAVTYDVPESMDIHIPNLILQPIVENAVRYGISRDGRRIVSIQIRETADGYRVCIGDRGKGMPQDIQKKLAEDEPMGSSIGLGNVHRRMKKLYGEDNGLRIISSKDGTQVELNFLRETLEGRRI